MTLCFSLATPQKEQMLQQIDKDNAQNS